MSEQVVEEKRMSMEESGDLWGKLAICVLWGMILIFAGINFATQLLAGGEVREYLALIIMAILCLVAVFTMKLRRIVGVAAFGTAFLALVVMVGLVLVFNVPIDFLPGVLLVGTMTGFFMLLRDMWAQDDKKIQSLVGDLRNR